MIILFLCAILLLGVTTVSATTYEGKIIGGGDTQRTEFPFAVNIRRNDEHYCAGSIIDKDWILTSAHCASSDISSYSVIAGAHDLAFADGNEQVRTVDHIIIHPNYTRKFVDAKDIALMHVFPSFELNDYVQPVTIRPESSGPTPLATVIGWGQIGRRLQKVSIPLISNPTCQESYGLAIDAQHLVCYGETGKDACQGDTGGALVCGSQLCGLVSAGRGCGRFPTIYIWVPSFAGFISEFTRAFPEDADPVLETRTCGGFLDTTSSKFSITSSVVGSNISCIWTVRVPRRSSRVRVIKGLSDASVYVTSFLKGIGSGLGQTSQLSVVGEDYILNDSMFFITINIGNAANLDVELEFYGFDFYDSLPEFTHVDFVTNSISYPGNGENYMNDENSLFVAQGQEKTVLEFTRMDVEPYKPVYCDGDYLLLFEWMGDKFSDKKLICGSRLPDPIETSTGVFVLNFITDGIYTYTGFDFELKQINLLADTRNWQWNKSIT